MSQEHSRLTPTWHHVCALEEIEPLWGEAALIDGHQIALIRMADDRVFALGHWDPVAKANVMARGIIGSKASVPTLASPINKHIYSLESGECLSQEGPGLKVYSVRVEDGNIEVNV